MSCTSPPYVFYQASGRHCLWVRVCRLEEHRAAAETKVLVEKIQIQPNEDNAFVKAGTALRALRCVACGLLIRTETYFECAQGCQDV